MGLRNPQFIDGGLISGYLALEVVDLEEHFLVVFAQFLVLYMFVGVLLFEVGYFVLVVCEVLLEVGQLLIE